MASGISSFIDETGSQQVMAGVTGTGLELGNGTPTAGFVSIDGTNIANGATFIGGVAQPPSQVRTSGSTLVNALSTATVTISLARNPLAIVEGNSGSTGVNSFNTTQLVLNNYGTLNKTVNYAYI